MFAVANLRLPIEGLAPAPQAMIYGLNYAVCFVLNFVLGGTLATKQPAYTASRLADALRPEAEYESFPHLVRAICRSQFVSFVGNVVGAAALAALIMLLATKFATPVVDSENARHLAESLHPLNSRSIYYAAIAGVLLSIAGFVAGFVHNAVVLHRIKGRIHSGTGVLSWLPRKMRARIADRIEQSAGELFGNALLGFLLGSAGGIGHVLGVPLDIRHIAFASSHAAVSFVALPELHTLAGLALMSAAVAIIGLVNFIVSFGLTLTVAAHARRLENTGWIRELRAVWRLFLRAPIAFFVPARGSEPDASVA